MISTVSPAMRPVAPAVDPDIDTIGHLSLADLLRLWQQPLRLFRLANFLRERCCGDAVSFVVNRNINFTNICTGSCRFCSFKHHEPYTLSHEQILRRAADAEEHVGALAQLMEALSTPGVMAGLAEAQSAEEALRWLAEG